MEEIELNKIAVYQGYIIRLTKYENEYISNTRGITPQIINAMIFREENMAKEWLESYFFKLNFSNYEIIPFVCEWKF